MTMTGMAATSVTRSKDLADKCFWRLSLDTDTILQLAKNLTKPTAASRCTVHVGTEIFVERFTSSKLCSFFIRSTMVRFEERT